MVYNVDDLGCRHRLSPSLTTMLSYDLDIRSHLTPSSVEIRAWVCTPYATKGFLHYRSFVFVRRLRKKSHWKSKPIPNRYLQRQTKHKDDSIADLGGCCRSDHLCQLRSCWGTRSMTLGLGFPEDGGGILIFRSKRLGSFIIRVHICSSIF